MRKYEKYTNMWRRRNIGTSCSPGRTALGGVTSLSRKWSSLQQEVRGFSSFVLFCDWAGGSDQVVSALSRDVQFFLFCTTTQNQRLLKESIKIDAKIRENTSTCESLINHNKMRA